MKKIEFTVEKGPDGYGAYRQEPGNSLISTMGDNLTELKANIVEAYNLFQSEHPKNQITADQVVLNFDLASFFELYNEINASAIGKRIGMQKSLLSEYINGKRKPSPKQVQRIIAGVKELGKELTELELV